MHRTLATSLLLTTTLALIGCTDTTDTTDATDTGTMDMDIVDIASADANFSILVQAVVDAGLEGTLRGEGPFTVFAPTDDAFDGIDLSGLEPSQLAEILTYHVVSGDVPSSSVPDLADSVAGFTLFFDTSAGVMVNDATVTMADIEASNGIIHVIDTVLMPPDIIDAAGYAGLSGLAGALGAANPAVATALEGEGPFTVFAPTNAAFDDVAAVTKTLDADQLADVLLYHAYAGEVTSDAVPATADSLLQNPWGNGVTALFDTSAGVVVNGSAEVQVADVITTNGVVHVIDQVLLPPTVVGLAQNAGLTGLLDTVGAASGDLGTVLGGDGPFTVFAPSNAAFADITEVAAGLSADALRDILLFHVVGGAAPAVSSGLTDGEVASLLAGQTLTIDTSAGVMVESATVVIADVHGTNGVVHVIDSVMLPAAR